MSRVSRWAVAYLGAALTFCILDGLWIGLVAQKIYSHFLPQLLANSPALVPATVFYLGYLVGVVHLAVRPGQLRRTSQRLRDGALLGAVAYGTWGFTAAALLRGFPLAVTLSDVAWGAVLTGASAVGGGLALAVHDGHSPARRQGK
ncbi:DUF2177 family protein [Buchananella hordeovulneris]|uniref:DUF2177 family protein n=1 Tax=Buchananella hordeovulneris TaxID=52770 RepID=UPI000F5E5881|nr:DUF2177 family protein [Buchananella hordeovulneris]RRD45416.1 DUF2177 family protein [Buchananella hordeovulneris]